MLTERGALPCLVALNRPLYTPRGAVISWCSTSSALILTRTVCLFLWQRSIYTQRRPAARARPLLKEAMCVALYALLSILLEEH